MNALLGHEAEEKCGTSVAPLGEYSLRQCELGSKDGSSTMIGVYEVEKK
jgi:hypothetical protein